MNASKITVVLAAAATALLSACGSSGGSGFGGDGGASGSDASTDGSTASDGGSPAASISCADFASALCDRLYACGLRDNAVTSPSQCLADQTARCTGYSTASGSHLDGAALATCANGLPSDACAEVALWLADDWGNFSITLPGTLAIASDIGGPHCIPKGDAANGAACALGTQCASGVCQLSGAYPQVHCGTCIANPCGSAWCGGVCGGGTCIVGAPNGSPCPEDGNCASFRCEKTGSGPGTCVAAGLAGDPCDDTASDTECATGFTCTAGTCTAITRSNVGGPCTGDIGCLPGLNCHAPDYTCESNAQDFPVGALCLRGSECPGAMCINEACTKLEDAVSQCH